MGCPDHARQLVTDQLRHLAETGAPMAAVDEQLDYLFHITHRATEWDADRWGLNPDRWMARERKLMESRILRARLLSKQT